MSNTDIRRKTAELEGKNFTKSSNTSYFARNSKSSARTFENLQAIEYQGNTIIYDLTEKGKERAIFAAQKLNLPAPQFN